MAEVCEVCKSKAIGYVTMNNAWLDGETWNFYLCEYHHEHFEWSRGDRWIEL
jgi:hypothetical protein